jgi:hypothetical protein
LLTPWEMKLEILEDWLNNPEPVGDCHEKILAEVHSEESLIIFSQGAEKVMKIAEMKSVPVWQVKDTKEDDEDEEGMGDHSDLSNCIKFLQLGRLHEWIQPLEQLDEVIEKIRRLMVESVETVSKEKLSREVEATTTVVAAQKQLQQQKDGVDEQLQEFVWDPGGFQQLRWEAHKKELMNFSTEEYDARASLHFSHPSQRIQIMC